MLRRIIIAILVGFAAAIATWLVGKLLLAIDTGLTITIGTFLVQVNGAVGVLYALYWFVTHPER